MVRQLLSVAVVAGALVVPFAGGCEQQTVSEEKKVDVKDDGTVVREKETVKENSDGSVTKTETKSVDKPDNDKD